MQHLWVSGRGTSIKFNAACGPRRTRNGVAESTLVLVVFLRLANGRPISRNRARGFDYTSAINCHAWCAPGNTHYANVQADKCWLPIVTSNDYAACGPHSPSGALNYASSRARFGVGMSAFGSCAAAAVGRALPTMTSASRALSVSRVRNAGSSDNSHARSQAVDASGMSVCRRCKTSAPSNTLRRVSRARSCLPSRACNVFFCASSCARRCSIVRRVMMPSMLIVAIPACWACTCGSARRY
jgi:hypothetical protein